MGGARRGGAGPSPEGGAWARGAASKDSRRFQRHRVPEAGRDLAQGRVCSQAAATVTGAGAVCARGERGRCGVSCSRSCAAAAGEIGRAHV